MPAPMASLEKRQEKTKSGVMRPRFLDKSFDLLFVCHHALNHGDRFGKASYGATRACCIVCACFTRQRPPNRACTCFCYSTDLHLPTGHIRPHDQIAASSRINQPPRPASSTSTIKHWQHCQPSTSILNQRCQLASSTSGTNQHHQPAASTSTINH